MSRQVWEVAETKILAGLSRITGPAELNEMLQYLILTWPHTWSGPTFCPVGISLSILTQTLWNFSYVLYSMLWTYSRCFFEPNLKMFGYEMIFCSYIHHHFYIVATYCCTQNRLITTCNTDGSRTCTCQHTSQCTIYNNSFPLNLLNCSVGSTAMTCHTIHFSYSLPCISITVQVTSFRILRPCVALQVICRL